jgi:hypothetical protein
LLYPFNNCTFSTAMKTEVFSPGDATVSSLVEFYMYIESDKTEVRTIPNGRVDASIVLEGSLEWFFEKKKKFELLSPATLYPLTRNGGRARCPGRMICMAVKFYPHILALPVLEDKKMHEPFSFDALFEEAHSSELIIDLNQAKSRASQIEILDRYFLQKFFPTATADSWIQQTARAIESGSSTQLKIGKIADSLGISIKTLERRFQKNNRFDPENILCHHPASSGYEAYPKERSFAGAWRFGGSTRQRLLRSISFH